MRRFTLVVLLSFLCAGAADADQVTLKNGDRLSGTIVSADGKTLLLKTEFAGDVTIQWDAITAIDSTQNLNLTLKDGSVVAGKVATSDGKIVVTSAAGKTATENKDVITAVRDDASQHSFDVEAEKMAHPKFTYFWGGLFDTGLALTSGNSSTVTYTLSANAVRETPRDKLTLFAQYIYANDNSTSPSRTTANALRAGLRGDLNISPRLYAFAFGNFETNELQHLNLRQVYGGGMGYHVVKTANTTFDLFGGLSYDRDEFGGYTLPPSPIFYPSYVTNSAEALVGEELDTKLWSRTTFHERFTFFPNLSNGGQYRVQFDSSAATRIKNWLSWQVTFSDAYLSNPPVGLKGNDILLSTGLRVSWGRAKL